MAAKYLHKYWMSMESIPGFQWPIDKWVLITTQFQINYNARFRATAINHSYSFLCSWVLKKYLVNRGNLRRAQGWSYDYVKAIYEIRRGTEIKNDLRDSLDESDIFDVSQNVMISRLIGGLADNTSKTRCRHIWAGRNGTTDVNPSLLDYHLSRL